MIDTENAAAPAFWTAVGVSVKDLVYAQLVTVEEIFAKIEQAIGVARKNFPDKLVTIIVDSLAMASCETEMESEHGKDGYNTSKAIIISKALRKITGLIGKQRILVVFTNQLRMNMNAMALVTNMLYQVVKLWASPLLFVFVSPAQAISKNLKE
jgi:recombination protein RecA